MPGRRFSKTELNIAHNRVMTHKTNCGELDRLAYENARRSVGLDVDQLSVVSMIGDSTTVVIGFFTSLVYSRVSGLAPAHHQRHLAILATAFTLLVFVIIRVFVKFAGYWMWQLDRTWCSIVLRVVQFTRTAFLFLVTHFVGTLVVEWWAERQLSWAEVVASIYIIVVSIYFGLQVLNKSG